MDNRLIALGSDHCWHTFEITPTQAKNDDGAKWLLQFNNTLVLIAY